jgi:hypothetical protein
MQVEVAIFLEADRAIFGPWIGQFLAFWLKSPRRSTARRFCGRSCAAGHYRDALPFHRLPDVP